MNSQDQNFKEKLNHSINQIEVPESIFQFAKELPYQMDDNSIVKNNHRILFRSRKLIFAIAASIVIGISIGSYVSPTFAAYLKSLFDRSNLDQGLQEAAQLGYSVKTTASVTDQGITFQVHEVMADSKRVILSYSLQKDGQGLDPSILFDTEEWGPTTRYFLKELNSFYVTNQENHPVSISTTYGLKSGRHVTQSIQSVIYPHPPFADVIFKLNDQVKSNQLSAHVSLNKIGAVKGNWELEIPIDIKKSQKATKTVDINKSYTTPEGFTIDLKDIVYTPMSTSMNIKTSWTEEAIRQMNKDKERFMARDMNGQKIMLSPSYYHTFEYEVVDENGNIMMNATVGTKQDPKRMIFSNQDFGENGKSIEWQQSFVPIPQDKKLTFILKSFTRSEFPNLSAMFIADELDSKNTQIKYKDLSFTLKDMVVKNTNSNEKSVELEMEGKVFLGIGDFDLMDSSGKVYHVNWDESTVTWLERDPASKLHDVKMKLRFDGFNEIPEKLKVSLIQASVTYPVENWTVPIN